MIFTGKLLTGNEAAKIGLVNEVVENPYEKALSMAKDILKTVINFKFEKKSLIRVLWRFD